MVSSSLREAGEYRRMAQMTQLSTKDNKTLTESAIVDNSSAPKGGTVGEVRCANPFIVAENINVFYGDNEHHIIEAIFKSTARALDQATSIDDRLKDVRSSKGVL